MGKVTVLIIIILLALVSLAGYLFLADKIITGEGQIAAGQIQIEKGQPKLDEGKAKLEAGKLELSAGKKKYEEAKENPFLVLADKVLKGGKSFSNAKERIAKGDSQIASGQDKVNAGEKRLEAGKLELRQGKVKLKLARAVCVGCAIAALFLASLSIVLGVWWRRSLPRIFRHART